MREDQISNEIDAKAPPNSAKNVTSDLPHSSHQTKAMVYLGDELEHYYKQKYTHYHLNPLFSYQFWYY